MNGDDLCRAMRSGGITTPVCLLSADARRSTLVAALGSGAGGFVHKSAETGELLDVLDRVACGREALDSLSAVQLVGGPRRGGATSLDAAQVAWLSGLADGVAAIELAGRAGVRVRDLNALRDRTLSQLAAPHEAAAVGWALRNKIIE
jgi:DNA-binding NarL/FixJ family response regulator